jgi:orotidine-5'-phosphate decarboxylase
MLQPNDLPLVCLPLDLPPEAVAELIAFLHELTEALERHYGASLKCHYDTIASPQREIVADDPPF